MLEILNSTVAARKTCQCKFPTFQSAFTRKLVAKRSMNFHTAVHISCNENNQRWLERIFKLNPLNTKSSATPCESDKDYYDTSSSKSSMKNHEPWARSMKPRHLIRFSVIFIKYNIYDVVKSVYYKILKIPIDLRAMSAHQYAVESLLTSRILQNHV